MNHRPDAVHRRTSRRMGAEKLTCPSCGGTVGVAVTNCPACRFTGADSMKIFPGTPPPLLPVLDVADLWNAADIRIIEAARAAFGKRFPQFHWSFCAVDMAPTVKLNLLGFWLMNAAPLIPPQTERQRAWTTLLILNRSNGQAAIIPGYAAEPWLPDAGWREAMEIMRIPWKAGESGKAIADFLTEAGRLLDRTWKKLLPSEAS